MDRKWCIYAHIELAQLAKNLHIYAWLGLDRWLQLILQLYSKMHQYFMLWLFGNKLKPYLVHMSFWNLYWFLHELLLRYTMVKGICIANTFGNVIDCGVSQRREIISRTNVDAISSSRQIMVVKKCPNILLLLNNTIPHASNLSLIQNPKNGLINVHI